ncbi:MAG TPA: hypothetical protein VF120_00185 [Ktedonobacterales bacterium]
MFALTDGTMHAYVTTPREGGSQAAVLAPGSESLTTMLADVAARTRVGALALPRSHDPETLVRDVLTTPPKTCGRSVTPFDGEDPYLCDECPLRVGGNRFVVASLPRRLPLQTRHDATATSVELTYRVNLRDRAGRTEEVVRVAFDADGQRMEPLKQGQAQSATTAAAVPGNAGALASRAVACAEENLRPALDALVSLSRMRVAQIYRKRQDDLTSMGDRLRRERPEDEQDILQTLQRELAALSDTFAVEVRATLESVYFVDAPMAEVTWRAAGTWELSFRVDTGRGSVSAQCASCGMPTDRGSICERGHVTCVSCGPGCAACRAAHSPGESSSARKPPRAKRGAGLVIQHLDALAQLTPRLWAACAHSLLAREGYDVRDADPDASIWHATRAGGMVVILRPPVVPGASIGGEDVRMAARHAREVLAEPLLLSLAPVTADVAALAAESGVAIWDRAKLEACLAAVASEQMRATSPTRGESKERVAAAVRTRDALLDVLTKAAATLEAMPVGERVAGLAALSAAICELAALRRSVEQAFLAWETLIADWLAQFPERVTPSGGLVIDADKDTLHELRERATHLGKALVSVFERLSRAPRRGELGYDAWCAASIEEYAARLSALRAQVALVDPTEWEDARRARSSEAEVAAVRADQDWRHAAARAAKAYAQVAQFAVQR